MPSSTRQSVRHLNPKKGLSLLAIRTTERPVSKIGCEASASVSPRNQFREQLERRSPNGRLRVAGPCRAAHRAERTPDGIDIRAHWAYKNQMKNHVDEHLSSTRTQSTVIGAQAIGAKAVKAQAIGSLAIGALAVGAVAIGALAIGRLVIGRLTIRRARLGVLEMDELRVGRLHVRELVVDEKR